MGDSFVSYLFSMLSMNNCIEVMTLFVIAPCHAFCFDIDSFLQTYLTNMKYSQDLIIFGLFGCEFL